jgi:hypothetical protein
MKSTPKSCSCSACKAGKSSKKGKCLMKLDERAYRHEAKIKLNKGKEDIPVAPKGNYYD